jgi:hypothetical protein
MDRIELPLGPRHILVPLGACKMISKPMACLVQTMHLCCTETNNVSKWTEMRFHMTLFHLGVPSSVSKMIFEPVDETRGCS